jgi:two-component system cell cycle sensor histidine kinase/response regulator CckA
MTRVLIVDDKADNLYYLRALLSASGFTVDEARHGAEALIVARSHPPDVVVSDLLMPVMDGYTLLRYWKADPTLRRAPFVVYTATYTEDRDAQLAMDLGADAFLLKPAEPDALLARIREVLGEVPVERSPRAPSGDPRETMQVYSETLIRKLEEKSLQLEEANRRLSRTTSLLEVAGRIALVGGWWYDVGAKHVVWSDEVCRIHGEPVGTAPDVVRALGYYVEDARPVIRASLDRCVATGESFDHELQIVNAAGRKRWVRAIGEAVRDDNGRIIRVHGAFQDVTEAKRVREGRRELAERLRETLESISDAVLMFDRRWRVTFLNPEGERLLQRTALDLIGKVVWDEFPEAVGSQFQLQYQRAVDERIAVHFQEFFPPLNTWFEVSAYPTRDGIAVYFRDITARRLSERRIAQQAALLDKAQDAILVRALDDTIIYWNKSAERLYGWTAAEALGQSAHTLVNASSEEFTEARDALLERGEWMGTLRQVRKDGTRVITECRWTLVRDDAGNPESILAINTDITERRNLEQQFLRAQRLESIGTLAGGIAHDLNNILAPIMMSLDLLRDLAGKDGRDLVESLEGNVKRGADLVRQVLTFARGLDGRREPVDLCLTLREMETLVRDTFPKTIELETRTEGGPCLVLGDSTQLHQVLLNLVVNARDAMPNGGRLRIALQRRTVDEPREMQALGVSAGRYIVASVQDDGEGMSPQVQQMVFEPFYTTKGVGKGTGLGLSTVMSIVRGHGGAVQLNSTLGVGTTFSCYFPEIVTDVALPQVVAKPRQLPGGEGEVILVVDDEPAIRSVAERILTRHGYVVILAENGQEAVTKYREHRERIAAVITDVSMPIMDGPATIKALRAISPDLPIIVSSGYVPDEGAGRLLDTGAEFFISKPFTAEALLTTIRGVLAGRG